jgi:cathepsin A (carboxypeptidase C)
MLDILISQTKIKHSIICIFKGIICNYNSHSNPKDDPIILWLGGGTSCSSLVGMMYTGPFVFGPQADIAKKNNHTWNTNASLLYI